MEDQVCVFVMYPVKVEKDSNGVWSWNYSGCESEHMSTILRVHKNIKFEDLYALLKEELKIDTTLYDFEMIYMVPIRKAKPMVLKNDKLVTRFFSVFKFKEDGLFISLKPKEKEKEMFVDGIETNVFQKTCEEESHLNTGSDDLVQDSLLSNVGEDFYIEQTVGTENADVFIPIDENGDPCNSPPIIEYEVELQRNELEHEDDHRIGAENVDTFILRDENDAALNPPSSVVQRNELETEPEDDHRIGAENVDGFIPRDENDVALNPSPSVVQRNESEDEQVAFTHTADGGLVCIQEDKDFHENDSFESKMFMVIKAMRLATKYKFEFKTQTSNKQVYSILCKAAGCKWRLRGTRLDAGSEQFVVAKYANKHSCRPIPPRKDHRHASHMVIGEYFATRLKDSNHINAPKDLIEDFGQEFGYQVSYSKAYRAKGFAERLIRGNPQKRVFPEDVLDDQILPPKPKKQSGPPSIKRKRSRVQGPTRFECGKCGGSGHYASTCTGLIGAETPMDDTPLLP